MFPFASHPGSEILRAASSFKRRRESQTLRNAVPLAAFLFVVVGPSDLDLCLIGALHYISLDSDGCYVDFKQCRNTAHQFLLGAEVYEHLDPLPFPLRPDVEFRAHLRSPSMSEDRLQHQFLQLSISSHSCNLTRSHDSRVRI